MERFTKEEEQKLRYAKRKREELVETNGSYFCQAFDPYAQGISACPGRKNLPCLAKSCYDPNYKNYGANLLSNVETGKNPFYIGDEKTPQRGRARTLKK